MDKMKYCCICEESFPATTKFFHKRHNSPDGLRCECKECRKNDRKKDYNKPFKRCTSCKKLLPNNEEYFYKLNKGKDCANRALCIECHAEYQRNYKLVKKYGITVDDYERMYKEQGGKCAICEEKYDSLVVDHCHTTGKVRSLLCNNCNSGFGYFKEDSKRLNNAIKYKELWDLELSTSQTRMESTVM